VTFSNGDSTQPVLGFAGGLMGGDGPILFAETIYLTDGKAMPLNSHVNMPSCHFYFTDHGTFTQGWENRLTTIECNLKVKGADGHLVTGDVRFDVTRPTVGETGNVARPAGSGPKTKSYDPIPNNWKKIDVPGLLPIETEYCTESGECHFVGEEVPGLLNTCQTTPAAERCLKARMPVQILAVSSGGLLIVSLNGRNYSIVLPRSGERLADGSSTADLLVIYHGKTMTAQAYVESQAQRRDPASDAR
jgi:hypothetical protein